MRFWRGCGGSTSQCTIEYFTYSGNQRQILNEHKRASRQVTVITGAGSGIGRAVAISLAKQGVKALGLVDRDDSVQTIAEMINKENGNGQKIAEPFLGYTARRSIPEADLRPDSRPVRDSDHLRRGSRATNWGSR